ncbi:Peptidase S26 [Crateriforma conspicua]|nr:Peptidase S26 [Crateriforma conspicua]
MSGSITIRLQQRQTNQWRTLFRPRWTHESARSIARSARSSGFFVRRSIAGVILIAVPLLVTGCRPRQSDEVTLMKVAGGSMAPAWVGRHGEVRCEQCLSSLRIVTAMMPPKGETFVCPFCGGEVTSPGVADRSGDVVAVHHPRGNDHRWQRGDLVAVRRNGIPRLKRLVALPGDVVALDGLRLTVNGRTAGDHFDAPLIVVNQDWLSDPDAERPSSEGRPFSWWQPSDAQGRPNRGWARQDSAWTAARSRDDATPSWLVYRHRNVFHSLRQDSIRDNYPGNVSLVRPLYEVDRLVLTANVQAGPDASVATGPLGEGGIEVYFWTPDGIVMHRRPLPRDMSAMRFYSRDAVLVPADRNATIPVTQKRPVAITAPPGTVVAGLLLERPVEYRLRRTDATESFPLRLGEDQFFVLGDNVPVSVDSRKWGPIRRDDLIGWVPATAEPIAAGRLPAQPINRE